jgi:hypothetical protein
MEPLTSTPQKVLPSTESSQEGISTTPVSTDAQKIDAPAAPMIHHTKNLYPLVRHILLVICVLFSVALIILLIHQNGKSIYDNGI